MKFFLLSTIFAAVAVRNTDASASECAKQYGPPPNHPSPVYVVPAPTLTYIPPPPPVPAPVPQPTHPPVPPPTYPPVPPPTPYPTPPPSGNPTPMPLYYTPYPYYDYTTSPTASPSKKPVSATRRPSSYFNKRELTFDPRCKQYGYYRNLQEEERNLKVVSTADLLTTQDGDDCSNAPYDIYLVIQGAHFAGLGTPAVGGDNNNKYASCPNIVMHSKSDNTKTSPMEKVVMVAGSEEVALVSADEKLHLGTRPLFSIAAAFDSVDAGKDGQKFYDAITNNCVALLRNMAGPLDIPIDDRMIGFVSKRMLSSTADHMFESIRESPALNTLYEGSKRFLKGMSKEDMLAKLIKIYV